MATTTTDFFSTREDAPATTGAQLPARDLETFVNAELLDAADELAALQQIRRQFERLRLDFS